MFFIPCDNWKTFFHKSLPLFWDFFNRHIVAFFETSVLKENWILRLRYLHNNSAVLILKFPQKLILYLINFCNLFYDFLTF